MKVKKTTRFATIIVCLCAMAVLAVGMCSDSGATVPYVNNGDMTTVSSTSSNLNSSGSMDISLMLTEMLTKGGTVVGSKALSWVQSSVMNMIGMPDFETLVGSQLAKIDSDIQGMKASLSSIEAKIDDLAKKTEQVTIIAQMDKFSTQFQKIKNTVELLYPAALSLERSKAIMTKEDYAKSLENLIRLINRINDDQSIEALNSASPLAIDVLEFGSAILPAITNTGIFDTMSDYFEIPCIWGHEAYDQRNALRVAILGLYEKAMELARLDLNYRIDKKYGYTALTFSPLGKLLSYVDVAKCGREVIDAVEYEEDFAEKGIILYKNFDTAKDFYINMSSLLDSDYGFGDSYYHYLSLAENENAFASVKYATYQNRSATALITAAELLAKQAAEVATLASEDMQEIKENSAYRIHLKMFSDKIIVMNKNTNEFYIANDVGTTPDSSIKTCLTKGDTFTLPSNGRTYPLNGYKRPAVFNGGFTPSNQEIFNRFLQYIPQSYKIASSNKTMYDYLVDMGFGLYGKTSGKIAVGAANYHYRNKAMGYKLSLVYVRLEQKLNEPMKYLMTSAAQISDINKSYDITSNFKLVATFNTPLINLGFPSCYSTAQVVQNISIKEFNKHGANFGLKITENVTEDSRDSNTTDNGENRVSK